MAETRTIKATEQQLAATLALIRGVRAFGAGLTPLLQYVAAWESLDELEALYAPPSCDTCGILPPVAHGECRTCVDYRRRTGEQRPGRLVRMAARRAEADDLAQPMFPKRRISA